MRSRLITLILTLKDDVGLRNASKLNSMANYFINLRLSCVRKKLFVEYAVIVMYNASNFS